ncbi:hypothetical protein CGCVW01_v012693 [Colletotrichum viniferum]|nr:hypothetical protein CGCVW01_v012693 [Colletotrichum viniferum]
MRLLTITIGSEYENLFVFSDIEESTGSSQTLDLAYSWFRECTSRHTRKCKAHSGQTEGWLPSGIIDIGSHGDTQWKLLITSTDAILSESLLYLTLSYRWGDDVQHELLTSSTMSQFRQGVEISSLPKTFQDTVIVARRLGIRYIWIDCLCIIQDSRDDWETEAPEMRHVYVNAACNIAASASDDADRGLFRSRDRRDIRPGLVTSTLASGHPKTFYIFDKGYWDRHLLGGSLHRRGWVFQERFLGPRQLYFTQHQALWECLEEHKCEGFPRGIPLHTSFKDTERLLKPFEELWCNHVTAYAQCHFTKPEDKLYAFSGIAKLFQEVSSDRYLAGIWRSRVLYLLNWSVFTPKPKLSVQYRAPSWSWASVDGPLKMHTYFGRYNFQVTVLEMEVTTKSGGQDVVDVTGGFIKLRGPLITRYYTQQHSIDSDGQISIQLKDGDNNSWNVRPFPDTTETQFAGRGMINFLVLSAHEDALWSHAEFTSKVETEIFCIILAPISESDRIYKRIGWFRDRHQKPPSQIELLSAFREHVEDIIMI